MGKPSNTDVFQIQYDMLHKSGAWPEKNPTLWYRFKGFTIFTCTVALCATMLIETLNDLTNFTKLSEILYVVITVTAYIIKHASCFVQSQTFIQMFELLRDPIFLSYPDDLDSLMVKRIKSSQLLANAFRYLIFACVILVLISPFIDNQPLPFPFPYDLGKYRYAMFAFQVVSIALVGWNNSQFDCLLVNLMGLAATQLEILSYTIKQLMTQIHDKNNDLEYGIIVRIKRCIKQHSAIMEFVECVDKVFSFCILSQFLGSIIIICNTLFNFILIRIGSSQFFMLVNYLAVMISQLFMYCWFGNEIIWMSSQVGEACYSMNWYNCESRIGKYLFIIMERSKRPLKITVFKFSIVSLSSFTTIIQWSYSYFALLLKLYNKRSTPV